MSKPILNTRPEENEKSRFLAIRLTPALDDAIRNQARRDCISVAAVVRQALARHLRSQK